MSIIRMEKVCEKCHRKYNFNPDVGVNLLCPHCLGTGNLLKDKKKLINRRKKMGDKRVSKEFLLERAGKSIGEAVYTGEEENMKEYARKAATICRRRFNSQDVAVMSLLDEEQEGDAGIAFTEQGAFYWEDDDNFIFGFDYSDVSAIDYDSNGVKITLKETGERRVIPCINYDWDLDEDEEMEYIREMYNFIADIVDAINA